MLLGKILARIFSIADIVQSKPAARALRSAVPESAKNEPLKPFAIKDVAGAFTTICNGYQLSSSCLINTETGVYTVDERHFDLIGFPDSEFIVVKGYRLNLNGGAIESLSELQWILATTAT